MADPFRPKFVDLVRNFTTTTGTGNFTVGAAVPGHSGLATAVAVGERFFYCVQGIDRPGEREVGRGTMLAGGAVAREPVGGAATNFSSGIKTIALVVAADWFTNLSNWINGGAENLTGLATTDKSSLVAAVNEVAAASSSGGGSGGAVGSTLTFTSASGAAIPAATIAIETAGYAGVGKGAARYVFDAAVNAAFVTANPRTAFIAAGGRGFRLDADQRLTIEMFGGKADWNGTAGTDNYAAMKAAHEFAPNALGFSPTIHYGFGKYYCGQTLEPQAAFHITGQNRGLYSGAMVDYVATRLVWPVDTPCLRVKNSNTLGLGATAGGSSGAASGSIIEGVCIQQNSLGTSLVAHGIHARSMVIARYCEFTNIAGDCLNIGAIAGSGGATEGDANDWRVEYCFAHLSNGSGLYVWGADANGGTSLNFVTHNGVKGCGIRDESYLGNSHVGPQITGYGNKGVHLGGVHYQLISTNAADTLGGATAPGTNRDIWYPLRSAGVTSQFPDWASGTTYRLALPLWVSASQTCIFGGYEEHGSVVCHVKGQLYGGGFSTTDTSNATEVNGVLQAGIGAKNGIGYYESGEATGPLAAANGAFAFTMIGSKDVDAGPNGRRNLIEHRIEQDAIPMFWRWVGKDQVLQYFNQKEIFSFGGPGTARTYGRASAQPYYLTLHDFALQDSTNSNNRRIVGLRDVAPTTGSHAQGEFFFNVAPTASGVLGWCCTTAGTPGTWTAVPVAGFAGSYLADASFGNITMGQGVDGKQLRIKNSSGYGLRASMNGSSDSLYLDNDNGSGWGGIFIRGTYVILHEGGNEVLRTVAGGVNITGAVKVNGTQVVGARGAAVADATDAATAITQLNALLARCRAHGLIA